MRLARALAAAALTLGLASALTPAQAAPAAPPTVQVVDAPVQAKAEKATTKLTAKVPKKPTKVGKKIKITGKLTRKGTDGKYKPLAKQQVVLIAEGEDSDYVAASAKTSKSGKYTLKFKAEEWMVGVPYREFLTFQGNANSAESYSNWVNIKVKK